MGANAKLHVADQCEDIYKCVVIRNGNLRTAFYAHTPHLAKREARWFVESNRYDVSQVFITEPVKLFQNKPYT